MKRNEQEREVFVEKIKKEAKLLSLLRGRRILWHSLAMVGVIGWMIALPTVLGAYLGRFLDRTLQGAESISWTITFILLGLSLGIYSVWRVFLYRRKP